MGARNALFDDAARDLVCRAANAVPRELFDEVQTLVTVSCTHASSPGLERPLFEHAGLSPGVHRWNLGFMGCSAGLAALRLVSGLTPALRNALVCTCELSSLHFQYSNAVDQITANMLFADGAAVVVLSPQPSEIAVLNCRCVHLPEAADQMVWFADDHGLRLELSRALPDTLGAHILEAVEEVLAGSGKTRDQIAHWLVHPGGPKILDAVASALDLGPDALSDSRGVLNDFGNMSSSTVFFVLQRLLEQQKEGVCVALSFGPGLTIELVLLEVSRRRGRAD
jgi:predicted naringenin-chalcone synthase